jgi:hypothetical protein
MCEFLVFVALHFMGIVRFFFIIKTHVPDGIGEARNPGSSAHIKHGLLSTASLPSSERRDAALACLNKQWLKTVTR